MRTLAALPPLRVSNALGIWEFDGLVAGIVVVAVIAYIAGIRRLRMHGRRWPPARTVAFCSGLALIVLATQGFVGAYDTTLFSIHVIQHLILAMAAPLLLILGEPVKLAIQGSSRAVQSEIIRVLNSRPVALLTRPVLVWALYAGIMFGYYFTPLYELSLTNDPVHELIHVVFLAIGTLFFWVVLGDDPSGRKTGYPARVLAVLAAMPFHAFLGVALLTATTIVGAEHYASLARTWGPSLAADQEAGGALMWIGGGLVTFIALLVVIWKWWQAELRAGRRFDAATRDGPPQVG
jgi:cytochrome c oxidase assembly factor CtaG